MQNAENGRPRHRLWWYANGLVVIVVGVVALLVAALAPGQEQAGLVGGTPTSVDVLPALAYIRADESMGIIVCTGTVVAPRAVLTAGHCVVDENTGAVGSPARFSILLGKLDVPPARRQRFRVSRVLVLPGYKPGGYDDDAALLILARPTAVPPISLSDSTPRAGAASMVGWATQDLGRAGVLDGEFHRPEKLIASTVVQSQEWCRSRSAIFRPSDQLCAVQPPLYRTTACSGASGGPLVTGAGSGIVEIGLAIYSSHHCSPRRPVVFTQIAAIRPWLAAQLQVAERG